MSIPGRPSGSARLGELQRPACIGVLLRRLGRLVRPDLRCGSPGRDRFPLGRGVALLGCRHQHGVDDLSAHRQIPALAQGPVEGGEQRIDPPGAGQLLAEQPDRVLIGCGCAEIEAQEPQPAQAVPDQELHARFAHRVLCRQDQHLEHRHRIIGWTSALPTVAVCQCLLQRGPEQLEVHYPDHRLQRITAVRQPLQLL